MWIRALLSLILFSSCSHYTHTLSPSDDFLVVLVDAPGFDCTNGQTLLKTMSKHPRTWNKDSSVGHAWIFLHGRNNDSCFYVEGGHSGELGICQPRYFEGVIEKLERGDPNPVSYLWSTQRDGFYQEGAGGHCPTYAIKVNLSKRQLEAILNFIHRDYSQYSITENQCCTFAAEVAHIAGVTLEHKTVVPIPKYLKIGKDRYCLWEDPVYSQLCFSSPDRFEESMKRAVKEGSVEDALAWYRRYREKKRCFRCKLGAALRTIRRFPYRYLRMKQF